MKKQVFGTQRPQNGVVADSHEPTVRIDLPKPSGKAPFRLNIKDVLSISDDTQRMVFHTVGDTGGVEYPVPQTITASKMEDDLHGKDKPQFFYHLGDVAYYNSEDESYYQQFFKAYEHYDAPILSIAGNHDSSWGTANTPGSTWNLNNFMEVFCQKTAQPVPRLSKEVPRTSMIQPNVYWTLLTPLANFIGLYTNNSEHEGYVNDVQAKWFKEELINAQKEAGSKAIIVTLHHPPYSGDNAHGKSSDMQTFLTKAFSETGVYPDMVLSGHVHNFQRFTVEMNGRQIPFIVAGAGGYYNLHKVGNKGETVKVPNKNINAGTILENFCDDRHGYLKFAIDSSKGKRVITGEYFSVPRPQESWKAPAERVDYFELNLNTHKVTNKNKPAAISATPVKSKSATKTKTAVKTKTNSKTKK